MLFIDLFLQYIAAVAVSFNAFKNSTTMSQGEPYLGVYYPVDVSTYDAIYPSNPKPNVKEIVRAFTELIRLFVDMRYLDEEQVAFPPHREHPINLKYPARYGLTKDVVDIYQMIPYVTGQPNWNHGSDAGEFILGGEFLDDLRQVEPEEDMTEEWEQAVIDPTYGIDWRRFMDRPEYSEEARTQMAWDAEEGPYIRPWFAVLNGIGNHGSFLCLNTKTWRMWFVAQLEGSSDPYFNGRSYRKERKINRNDLDNFPNRPALSLLRDLVKRFKTLEWLPGGLYNDQFQEYAPLKGIYQAAGWPDAFDPVRFDRLRTEYEEDVTLFRHQITPLEQLDNLLTEETRLAEWKEAIPRLEREIEDLEAQISAGTSTQTEESRKHELEEKKRYLGSYTRNLGSYSWSTEQWNVAQEKVRAQLNHFKAERQLLIGRKGRFENMTDEEHEKALEDGWFDSDINEYETLLADKNIDARRRREERKIRDAVAALDPEIIERWLEDQVKWSSKDGEWVMQWTQFYEAGQDLH